ncbi:MAG: hypothetical protein JEY71_16450, partial [Sphaerochaeta sp.]|nr:hypothetical protein [Sphaerochaeta sp.]
MDSRKVLALICTGLLVCSVVFAAGTKETKSTFTMEDTKKQPAGEMIVTPQLIGYEKAEIELTWQPCPPHSMVSTQPARVEDIYAKATAWVPGQSLKKDFASGLTKNAVDELFLMVS